MTFSKTAVRVRFCACLSRTYTTLPRISCLFPEYIFVSLYILLFPSTRQKPRQCFLLAPGHALSPPRVCRTPSGASVIGSILSYSAIRRGRLSCRRLCALSSPLRNVLFLTFSVALPISRTLARRTFRCVLWGFALSFVSEHHRSFHCGDYNFGLLPVFSLPRLCLHDVLWPREVFLFMVPCLKDVQEVLHRLPCVVCGSVTVPPHPVPYPLLRGSMVDDSVDDELRH